MKFYTTMHLVWLLVVTLVVMLAVGCATTSPLVTCETAQKALDNAQQFLDTAQQAVDQVCKDQEKLLGANQKKLPGSSNTGPKLAAVSAEDECTDQCETWYRECIEPCYSLGGEERVACLADCRRRFQSCWDLCKLCGGWCFQDIPAPSFVSTPIGAQFAAYTEWSPEEACSLDCDYTFALCTELCDLLPKGTQEYLTCRALCWTDYHNCIDGCYCKTHSC